MPAPDCTSVRAVETQVSRLQMASQAHLHGAMTSIRDAALLCDAESCCDPLDRLVADVLGGTLLLRERQVHWRLVAANRACGTPCICSRLLDHHGLWAISPVSRHRCANRCWPTNAAHAGAENTSRGACEEIPTCCTCRLGRRYRGIILGLRKRARLLVRPGNLRRRW